MEVRDYQDSIAGAEAAQALQPYMGTAERLLWSGRPRQGLLLRAHDWFFIPFSLVWSYFALQGTRVELQSDGPLLEKIFPLIFVAAGVYFVVGRFFVDALQRKRTTYGVSNERILIVSGLLYPRVTSLNLRTLSDLTLTQKADGSGSITFAPSAHPKSWFTITSDAEKQPWFDSISQAKHVYDVIRDAQKHVTG